ncbi:MAG: PIN domain-containing protein [Candidatus Dormibacteraceae bacterium]
MTVLDAGALISALAAEPGKDEVERLLRSRQDPPRMAASNLAEVVDVLIRLKALGREEVVETIGWLRAGGLQVVPIGEEVAVEAGLLRSRHYHRQRCPISLGDCTALATAIDTAGSAGDGRRCAGRRGSGRTYSHDRPAQLGGAQALNSSESNLAQ